MKKHAYKILALALFSMISSCDSDYLNTAPTSSIMKEDALGSAQNLTAAINGMHRQMYAWQNDQGSVGYTSQMIVADAMGDDLVFPTAGNGWFTAAVNWNVTIDPRQAVCYNIYQFNYRLIANANAIIDVEKNNKPVEDNKNYYKEYAFSQAYAFRAFAYFNLVQYYGNRYEAGKSNTQLGVPLRLELTNNIISRATVEEVYNQIDIDLNKASEMYAKLLAISPSWTRDHKSHFDPNIIAGLKARVALTKGDWTLAAAEAKKARQGYGLMTNAQYTAGFNSLTNDEWMWGCEVIPDQNTFFGSFGAYMSRNFNSTNIRQAPKAINRLLYSLFPATDVRLKNFDVTGAHTALNLPTTFQKFPYTSQKFLALDGTSRIHTPFMRTAEMYLIEAEALARNGQDAAAQTVLFDLEKNRNPAYVKSDKLGDALITQILNSRRLELWGEGFRFLDLKRMKLDLVRTGSNHNSSVINPSETRFHNIDKWTLMIPEREIINSNGLVIQN